MRRSLALTALLLPLAACDKPVAEEPAEPIEEIRTYSGADAYEQVCASCHEEGLDGAPRTGVAEDWVGRSPLWEAVLFEHARKGYNEMPAKGGEESLGGDMVEEAAEYMLRQVTREPPPD